MHFVSFCADHRDTTVNPIHLDFWLNKIDTCLTVHQYNSKNHNAFPKSLVRNAQSLLRNLLLFPAFCIDPIVLSVEWSLELKKLFIVKNIRFRFAFLNVTMLFYNVSYASIPQFCSAFVPWSCGNLAGPDPYWLFYPQKTWGSLTNRNFPLTFTYNVYQVDFSGSRSTFWPPPCFLPSFVPSCVFFLSFCSLHRIFQFSSKSPTVQSFWEKFLISFCVRYLYSLR